MTDKMEPLGQRTNKLNQLFLSKSRGVLTTALRTHLSRDGLVDALLALYGECSQEQLMRNKHAATFVTKFKNTVSEVKKLQISINDFEVKDVIGRGHFGQVQVVREKVTGDVYAMKVLHKADTLSKENVAFYEEERDIMARASSHWLTRLQYAFQDDDNLYLIMEFHPGGDLLSLLARFDDVFEEPMARFYLAELVAAIHSLHTMGYVHRDIKPDNILLDRTGHIKLADFGSSAKLGKDGTVLSKMPVGTPDYVAPEVLMSLNGSLDSQYGTECDWWSLGIVAYEMMVGKTPFSSDSMVVTYSNIMDYKRKLSFPSNPATSPRATSLIKQLLCDRAERICYEGLGCHAFFSGIEWATLRDGVPPFVPTVSSVDDVSNFDEFDPVEPRSHNASALMRNRGGFSGHDLPFVGFTYTKTATGSSSPEMSLLNTTLSSPLDTSTMPDQRLQDRCRRLESQHSALTRQNNGISKTLKEKVDALKQVQAEKTVLERDLAEAVAELTKLKRVLEKERSDQKDVDSQAVRMLEEIRHTSKKEQELREEEWRSELEEYKQAFSQMEIDRHVAVKRAEKLEAELRQKTQDCADFQTQISSVKSKLNKTTEGSRSEVVELQAQLQKLSHSSQSQLDELRHKLQEAAEAESSASRAAERLRKEKAELREAVQEQCRGSVQELRATVMDLQQQLQESQDDQRSLENRLKMVHEREARLKEQVESKHTLTQDLASKIVDMEENLTATQRMCKQLEHDLVVKEREISGRERELKQQRAEATRTINKVSSLQADCEGSHLKKIAEQAESITVLDNQVKVLQAQIDKMVANRHHVLQQEQKELKRVENEKFSDLNQDRLYLQTQVGRLEFEMKQAQRAKTSLTDQSKDLQQKLDKAADKYEEEIYVLRDKLRQAQVKSERLEVSRQQVEASESELKQQVRTLQTKLQDEVEGAATKIDNLEGEKKLLDQELRVLRERSATVTTLETQLREKADQCSGLLQEKQELVGRCEAFAMEKGKLVSQSQQMEATLSDSQNKLGQNELNINMLKTTCTMLEQQVEDLDTITDRLEARLEECRQARDSAREELQQRDVALQGVTKSLEEAQQAMARTEEKLRELTETLDEKEKTHSDELDSWHKQFNEQRERINQLEENLSEVEKQRALLDVAAKELKQKYSDEQEDNIKLEKEMEEMDEKLKESKGINFQLTQCLEEAVSKGERIKEEKEEVENQLENQEIQHHHEKVKFEGTMAQQTKLIDFLQAKVDAPPKKKKGRLFGRTQQSAYGVASTGITGITYPMQVKELQQKLDAERSRAWELQKALDRARSDLQAAKLKATTTSSDFGSELSLPDLPSTPGFTQAANLISAIVQSPGNRGASPSSLILPTPGDKRTKALTNTGKGTMKRLKERMKHNIPHRFTVGLSMRGTKCAACADNIHFGRQVAKCQECHLICHPKCAHCLPHTCGLPFQFMRHFKQVMDGSPATTPRSVSSASSTASSTIQGWMKTPRSNKQGWEKKWVCLEGTKLCLYDKENSSGSGAPILDYDLCPTDGVVTVHAGVSSAELPRTASSDLPFVFRVESRPITTCWPDTKTLYLMAPSFQDKQQWMVGVEVATIRGRNAGPDGSMRDRARLIGNTLLKLNQTDRLDINCTLLINDGILLIGAEEGLYTMLLMDRQKPLSQLGGVSSVFQMQTITQLSLTVMITGLERKLSIVDLRHLRTMSSQATVSEVDINLTDIQGIESCHLFAAGKVDGSFYLCAAMPTKISILKYSEGLSKFCVRKEIQTAEPCSCLLFTEKSILAGTDRFYEIEVNDFKIDEFLESTDTSLAFAVYGASQLDSFPISAIQVAPDGEPEEFLLCFHEFGIFVDSKGRRSRPDDMKWSRLPLAFTYRQPYLYMAHFNSVEVCEIKQNGDTESPANRTFMDMANPRFVGPAITPGAVYIASLGDRNVELMCLQGNCASGPRENTSALDTSSSTVGDSVSCTGVDAAARNHRAMGPPPPPVTTVKRTPSQECRTPNVTPRRSTRSSMKRPLQESYDNTPRGKFSRTSARASARLPSASSSSEDELRRTKCGIKFGSMSGRKTRSIKR
ncbi:citron Rho-interacting kinase-like [Diadema antillarum]|uniref:citron Rho-interacting kinase-like n=1 Tax=Diadema antillarum TaxID=105358 RepID=UPI003A883864